ncbi:MAG: hypothetical protein IPJ78_07115 [Gemmatimonadetes bacterium]|nr:hypothetical protein [Gemmatimonadota bacterium]
MLKITVPAGECGVTGVNGAFLRSKPIYSIVRTPTPPRGLGDAPWD